jgi:hypothetical protein
MACSISNPRPPYVQAGQGDATTRRHAESRLELLFTSGRGRQWEMLSQFAHLGNLLSQKEMRDLLTRRLSSLVFSDTAAAVLLRVEVLSYE